MSNGQEINSWKDLTKEDWQLIVDIIRAHKNQKDRYQAYANSDLGKRFELTKEIFIGAYEQGIRLYLKAVGDRELDLNKVAIARLIRPDHALTMEEYDLEIKDQIKLMAEDERRAAITQKKMKKARSKTRKSSTDQNSQTGTGTEFAETIGTVIGYGIFVVPIILVVLYFIVPDGGSEGSVDQRSGAEDSAMAACLDAYESNVRASCNRDPEFAYCALNFDSSEIIGSGCTNSIKSLPGSQQSPFCIAESLKNARRVCAIEVYGCVAVTGDVNCD